MKELAIARPKHLIPVAGKPFLFYLLHNMKKAGFKRIILVAGNHVEAIFDFVEEHKEIFPNLICINQFQKMGEDKYGTALAILSAQDLIKNKTFISIYGDNLYSVEDLLHMRSRKDSLCHLYLHKTETPEKYGVPIIENGRVKDLIEKPKNFISNWVASGAYVVSREIFDVIKNLSPSNRGEYELTDAIAQMAKKGNVVAHNLLGTWLDFGNPEDVPIVENFLRSEKYRFAGTS